jgi:hypothetical protein
MLIAEKKKLKNISEYIIYMYQTEDLIRVYDFDIDLIEKYVIHHFPISEEEKQQNKDWYYQIIQKMKSEGVERKGHLSEVQKIVDELILLSDTLLIEDSDYHKIYKNANNYIKENLELSEGKIENEIQICLNGIYGLLLLRMKGKEVDESLMEPLNAFGDLLSYLSYQYKIKYN